MKYLQGSFTVSMGGTAYADGWERTFGKKDEEPPLEQAVLQEGPEHVCGQSREDVCGLCWEQWADAEPIPADVECSGGSCRRVRAGER